MRYYIDSLDNRGTETCPFGRIHLAVKKGGEVIGSIGFGSHAEDPNPYALWPTRDTPQLGRDHSLADRAQTMLRKLFPNATRIKEDA
jgi:hypothetical protein